MGRTIRLCTLSKERGARRMTKYRHIFVCPKCDEVASFSTYDNEKMSKNATLETSCSCGITQHRFYKTKEIE